MDDKIHVELDNLKLPRIYKSANYQISWIQNAEGFFWLFKKKKRNQEKYKNTTLGSMETWYEDYKKSSLIVWLTLNQLKYPSFQKVLYQYYP